MPYARISSSQSSGGYARIPSTQNSQPEQKKDSNIGKAASMAFNSTKDVISKAASYAEPVAKTIFGTVGRIFGGAVGGITGGLLEALKQVINPIPGYSLTDKLKSVGKAAISSGKQSAEFTSGIATGPIDIAKEIVKTTKATVQGLTGNEEAFIDRASEVLQRNANLGESVIGRPFSTKEEAKNLLMTGNKMAWASAIGGMGLDLSAYTGLINKTASMSGALESETGRVVDMSSKEFANRVGIRPETAPPGKVSVTEMQRTPLARATGPLSEFGKTTAPPKIQFKGVPQLNKGPEIPPTPQIEGAPIVPKTTPISTEVPVINDVSPITPRTLPTQKIEYAAPVDNTKDVVPNTPTQPQTFNGFTDLTTPILEKLKGRSTVSKQFIEDLAKNQSTKQTERDAISRALEDEGNQVNVSDFAQKVKNDLLPLERKTIGKDFSIKQRYEGINLPEDLRGDVQKYNEHIYESPVKTEAGDVHFSTRGFREDGSIGKKPASDNYFAHTRVEDLPPDPYTSANPVTGKRSGNIRRIIEIQSDLFQKGRLDKENTHWTFLKDNENYNQLVERLGEAKVNEMMANRAKEVEKLKPYQNSWWERVIREEVKRAAEDGKTQLQIPTGNTAMKIEGLGQQENNWEMMGSMVEPEDLQVGRTISQNGNFEYIITDILGDGKFKAMPKEHFDSFADSKGVNDLSGQDLISYAENHATQNFWNSKETFDISNKVDKENPIYKFYEKDIGRFLTKKYQAERIIDERGVDWWKVDIDQKMSKEPVMTLSARIGVTFKELDTIWQKAIGDKVWSSLINLIKKGAQKVGSGESKAAQFFRRFVSPKQFQGDLYVNLKDRLDVETQQAIEKALDFGNRLSKLSDAEQVEIVDRIVSGNYDDTKIGKLAEEVESAFMEVGQELVNQGKLSEETFVKNYGRYFPRLYEKFERDGIQKIMGKLRGLKADLSYIHKREDIPPEIREAMGEIKQAPYPVAKRLLQEGVDVAKLKFFDRVSTESNLASTKAEKGWVKLPDNKRLGSLSGKYVPAEIEYDINQLAKSEMRPKWLEIIDNANHIWKGVHTVLDTSVVTSNMVSNIILADFAGLPPQRLDVWAKAFIDTLKREGAYTGMLEQGKFRHTFVKQELQEFLPEIEKLKKVEVKSMTDVAGFVANAVKKGWIKAGDVYNFLEEWSKTAVYKYLTEEKNISPEEAANLSETWLFNYGDVPPIVDKMRKFPFGAPFITYAYKSIPRFVESGIRMPFTWLKYIIALNLVGGGAMMLKKLGMSEDEFRNIKPKTAGDWLVYIGRAADGTRNFADLTRYMSFGKMLNPRKPLSLASFAQSTASSFIPNSGSWGIVKLLQVIGALTFGTTFRDSFFDKIIFDSSEKMDENQRLYKAFDYLWSDWTPNWVPTPSGDNPKSADYLRKALSGQQTVTKGIPQKYTLPEALVRFFGSKNIEMNPALLRDFGAADINTKISKLKSQLKRATSSSERESVQKKINDLNQEKQDLFKSIGKLQNSSN